MHRVTIQYDVPADPDSFDEQYFDQHVPLLAPIPGLHSFTWSKPRPLGGEHLGGREGALEDRCVVEVELGHQVDLLLAAERPRL